MKTFKLASTSMILAILFLATQISFAHTITPEPYGQPPKWEKLGSRKVNFKAEKDVMMVTAWEGKFNAVRLKAEKSSINLHRFVIFYRNGQKQEVTVRKTLSPGQTTRVIELKGGGRRVINRVEFWYDTKGFEDKRGKIELWGRHFGK